jgi:hypothetical protein
MSIETVEQAIVYVLKCQKSFIVAEAEVALANGDVEASKKFHNRIENMGFGVKEADLTDEHEEARVDELFVWIERFDQATIKHTPTNRRAYDLLKNDEDLFLV